MKTNGFRFLSCENNEKLPRSQNWTIFLQAWLCGWYPVIVWKNEMKLRFFSKFFSDIGELRYGSDLLMKTPWTSGSRLWWHKSQGPCFHEIFLSTLFDSELNWEFRMVQLDDTWKSLKGKILLLGFQISTEPSTFGNCFSKTKASTG